MQIVDLAEETYFALLSNKSRSALTILGIVIGIGSVIALVAVGQGSAQSIQSNIQSLGTNVLVVNPGSSRNFGSAARGGAGSAETLKLSDAEALENQLGNYLTAVAPVVSSRKQVTVKGNNTNTSIYGVNEAYFTVRSITVQSGSLFNDQYLDRSSKVAVIGPTTRDDLFGEGVDVVGQKIRIDRQEYTVIGVTTSKGGTGFDNADDLIYVPLTTAQQYLTGSAALNNIYLQVSDSELMTSVAEQVTSILLQEHKISDAASADFSVINQADIMNTLSSVTGTLTLLLGAIAGISLLVGGIGIMNMMLTTVTERTREIGLRKSLGAKNKDISRQFLIESAAMTIIGGIIGIMLGYLGAYLVTHFSGTATSVTGSSVVLSFAISAVIGIVFGYYPARRAARLNPIEALRYE